jgi:ribose-phosphate pyrophosphokinase
MNAELDRIEEREFGDGEHKSRPLVSVRNEDVFVLHSLAGGDGRSAADRLVRLLFFIGACRDNGAARLTAVVPYLAFSRKEQQTQSRDPVSSRYVAELLEAVGTQMLVTLEVHNPAAFQNAFRCRTLHLDMREAFVTRLAEILGDRPAVFLSPDSGGMRRVHHLRQAYQAATGRQAGLAMMEKHRVGAELTGDLFAGDVAGSTVVILDDIVASGGTMLRAAKACRDRGAANVLAVATHGLFAAGRDRPEITGLIDRLFVTDSVEAGPLPPALTRAIEVIGCAPLLGQAIQRLHAGGSINRLLNPRP